MKPTQITLRNPVGTSAVLSTFGARLVKLHVPDKHGTSTNVVLGFSTQKHYKEFQDDLIGATVGRLAGRVENATFIRDGFTYPLSVNSSPHHLHGGGENSLDRVNWEITEQTESEVIFTHMCFDGCNGYPGNLTVTAHYSLTSDMSLLIEYSATTDQTTPVNLTHHSYWNLSGTNQEDLAGHVLKINAREVLDTLNLIPSGEVSPTEGTELDYSEPTALAERPWKDLDNSFVCFETGVVAELWHPATGITLSLTSQQPVLQVYAGKFLSPITNEDGSLVGPGRGLALEPQHVNSAISDRPELQTTLLEPGMAYSNIMKFAFSAAR